MSTESQRTRKVTEQGESNKAFPKKNFLYPQKKHHTMFENVYRTREIITPYKEKPYTCTAISPFMLQNFKITMKFNMAS